ncbi:hypothetical protein A4H97_19520 [Niastella yeongjuensis]|uniref:DUF6443 domain-containing protein n=1 Tax=Niastella yeongjuensis TaxID=354355 RepID=A0A1V9DZ02_9BACT|nr:DUF6443 domain-containing protein [Niastella yeongjuensis]OQP38895.1 hypothetical protein A4H97_19520 [Niastella yeongjuensis]SEO28659.1 RHS repeat-associated core domain-containing protein [Niastella yeongjuensis]
MTRLTTRLTVYIAFILWSVGACAQQPQPLQDIYSAGMKANYVRSWEANAPETDPGTLVARPLKAVKQTTQYVDGLGRPLQSVLKQGSLSSANGNNPVDLISPVKYDELGREVYKYLPFAANNTSGLNSINDGLFKLDPYQQQAAFGAVQYPGETFYYGQINYESSPFNRITESFAPGDSWTGTYAQTNENDRRSVKAKYFLNTSTDEVRIWTITDVLNDFGAIGTNGVYAAGELYKSITVDEQGKQVIEFKDKEGLVVLKKVQHTALADDGSGSGHTNWLCTYYIYDDGNLLRAVIQPQGVVLLMQNGWNITSLNGDILKEQCFRYEYDQRDRLTMKQVPGAKPVQMIYDVRDRLVFTQDANLKKNDQWLTTLYDGLNRPVITGLIVYTGTAVALQALVNTPANTGGGTTPALVNDLVLPNAGEPSPVSGDKQAINSIALVDGFEAGPQFSAQILFSGQTGGSSPGTMIDGTLINNDPIPAGAAFTLLTHTYYDNYDGIYTNFSTTDLVHGYEPYLDAGASDFPDPVTQGASLTGLVTWTKVKVLGEDKYITSCNLYDEKGRVIQVQTMNYTGAMDIVTNQFSFSGQLLRSHIKHQKSGGDGEHYDLATKYSYDDLGRIMAVEKNLNNTGWKAVATMAYNALGQVITKKLSPAFNNNAGIETLTYDYNIRGWMLGANRDYAKSTSNTTHYFGFDLGYDKPAIGSLGNYAAAQYSGNIAGTVWKSKGDGQVRKYDFTYDNVNRLTGANFTQFNSGFNVNAGIDFSVSNLTYDANGNILTQTQKGLKVSSSDYIDQLHYTYLPNSNRLQNVVDDKNDAQTKLGDFRTSQDYINILGGTKTAAATDYDYDPNGNLTVDQNKDITAITYNHLNLPQTITIKNKGSIDYTYDATGNKLKKTVHETGKPDKTTLYLFGTYENDVLQFLPQEEGRIRPVRDENGNFVSFTWDYFLKDHLDNVRMVLTEQKDQHNYIATMESGARTQENQLFDNLDVSQYPASTAGFPGGGAEDSNETVAYVNGNIQKKGPGIVLKVMAGDVVDIGVRSLYHDNPGTKPTVDLFNDILASLAGGIVSTSGVAKGTLADLSDPVNSPLKGALTGFRQDNNNDILNKPKAYLNWILVDEQFGYVNTFPQSGAKPVGAAETVNPLVQSGIDITKNGYLYIYVSNETENWDVFFDDLSVTHHTGPLLEETHYYPFGLTMAGISSKALMPNYAENKKQFNGIEHTTDLDINQYDAFYRTLDPQIGRFLQIDPKIESAEAWSPYTAMLNNPILHADPLGDSSVPWPARVANAVGNTAKGFSFGLNQRFQLEPPITSTVTGIRDMMGSINKSGKIRAQSVIRVDGPHVGMTEPHLNINPKVTGVPDPHIKLTPGQFGALKTTGQVLEGINKVAVPLALAADGMQLGNAIAKDVDEHKSGDNTIVASSKIAGGWTGAWLGAKGGGAIGAGFGSFGGPVGTAVGGFFGAIIGGIGGSFIGSSAGEAAGQKIVELKNE